MAVPYEGVPSIMPRTDVGGDYQQIQVDPAAFGTMRGQALEKLGQATVKSGLFFGEVAADDATNQLMDRWTKRMYGDPGRTVQGPDGAPAQDTGYFGLKGRAALDARPQLAKDLDADLQEIRDGLTTPAQQLEFDRNTRRYRQLVDSRVGMHADTESKSWYREVNKSSERLALDHIANNPDDGVEAVRGMHDLIDARVKQAQLDGGGAELVAQAQASGRRDALFVQIDAIGARDPQKALRMLDDKRTQETLGIHYRQLYDRFREKADVAQGIEVAQRAVQPVSPLDISAIGETGRPGREAQGIIVNDAGGSRSYGILGLNSGTGSAATFAREHPELGLTAAPGTAAFDQQWRTAAAEKPDDLYAAQRDWYDRHVVPQVRDDLHAAGIRPSIAESPRVRGYLADRRVQMGEVGLARVMAQAADATTPQGFIAAVSASDRANLRADFRTYLASHPDGLQGLANRIDRRGHLSAVATGAVAGFDYPDAVAKVMADTEAMRPSVRNHALQYLHQQHSISQASYLDQERQQRLVDRERREKAHQALDEVIDDVHSPAPKITAAQIVADPRLRNMPAEKEHALRLLEAENKPAVANAVSARNTKGLYDRFSLPEGDPRRINDLKPINDAFVSLDPAIAINKADHEFLVRTFREARDPQGEPITRAKAELFKAIEPIIDKSVYDPLDPFGKLQMLRFMRDIDAKVAEARKTSTAKAFEILDPNRYLQDPSLLTPYQPNLGRLMQQRATQGLSVAPMPGAPVPPGNAAAGEGGPLPANMRKLPNETLEAWLARTGQSFGPPPARPVVPQSQ